MQFSRYNHFIKISDTNILLPNKDEESKRQDLKIVYSIINNGKSETKKIVSKIIKMDEKNQYGKAMTNLSPTAT